MPHPSITGMAAGLSVAQYLNQGTSKGFGKGVLTSAIVLATAGGLARKWFPSVKLGGTKLYFKI